MKPSDQLRQAVRDSGLTHYAIAKPMSISIRTIDRFVTEGKPIRTEAFDELCERFGLELKAKRRKR